MTDSQTAVAAAFQVDGGFVELCKTLFGDVVDPQEAWAYLYAPEGQSLVPAGDAVAKMGPDMADMHIPGGDQGHEGDRDRPKRKAVPTGRKRKHRAGCDCTDCDTKRSMAKSLDDDVAVVWEGTFAKTDDEKRQVFGWASIVEVAGEPVVDLQGDVIAPDELERAAYDYVHKSRVQGDEHARDGSMPLHVGDMIESVVFTPEKIAKMGLPDDFPVGWWVGYQVEDEPTWQAIKSGERSGFSIHGKGRRTPIEVAA